MKVKRALLNPLTYVATSLIVVTLAVFGPAWDYDFVGWDDDIHVYNNPHLSSHRFGHVLHFWKEPHESLYMPATWSAWWLLARVSERLCADNGARLDPCVFHWSNIILHTVNVLLVFAVLERLFAGASASLSLRLACASGVGALLYAVHPLQVEPVVWVSSMKDLFCGLFSLLALWQYLLYAQDSVTLAQATRKRHVVFATAAFVFALLSKPAAVSLPLVAWLLVHFRYRNADFGMKDSVVPAILRSPHALLAFWLLIAAPFAFTAKLAQRDISLDFVSPLWARLPLAGDALGFYLIKLVLPLRLGIDYGRTPRAIMGDGWAHFTWIIPCSTAAVLILSRHRRQWLSALGIFVAGVIPTLGLVPHGYQVFSTVADRYLYLSMLGPALALGWIFFSYRNKAVACLCLFIIFLLAWRSLIQRQYWSDNKNLLEHALEINNRSYMAHYNLGLTLDGDGRPAEAVLHYEKALEIKPDYGRAHNNLGAVLTRQGRLAEAIGHFSEALRLEPGNEGAYFNLYMAHNTLGVELASRGDLDEAVYHYRQALRINPLYADGRNNLGVALARQGKIDEAVEHFSRALGLRPDFAEARANLNQALQSGGKK